MPDLDVVATPTDDFRAVARVRAKRITELVKQSEQLHAEARDARAQQASWTAQIAEARRDVAALRAELKVVRSSLAKTRSERDKARATLAALRRRRSVRITLRVANAIGRLRRR